MNVEIVQNLKSLLHQEGRLRVWSIIVTIMGDVVEAMGGDITIAELIDICTLLDIEPQAVRTAISRLAKEGWLERNPKGKSAEYSFSTARRDEFLQAAQFIYAPPKPAPSRWKIGVLPHVSLAQKQNIIRGLSAAHPICVNNQFMIWSEGEDHILSQDILNQMTIFDHMPLAFAEGGLDHVSPSPNIEIISELCTTLKAVKTAELSPQNALIIRILVIHFWRRIVLKHPGVHAPFGDAFWPLPTLHHELAEIYERLAIQSESALPRPTKAGVIAARFIA